LIVVDHMEEDKQQKARTHTQNIKQQ
jgi:hypothetical protein